VVECETKTIPTTCGEPGRKAGGSHPQACTERRRCSHERKASSYLRSFGLPTGTVGLPAALGLPRVPQPANPRSLLRLSRSCSRCCKPRCSSCAFLGQLSTWMIRARAPGPQHWAWATWPRESPCRSTTTCALAALPRRSRPPSSCSWSISTSWGSMLAPCEPPPLAARSLPALSGSP
jgi:hypothetical protein